MEFKILFKHFKEARAALEHRGSECFNYKGSGIEVVSAWLNASKT